MSDRWRRPVRFEYVGPTEEIELVGGRKVAGAEIAVEDETWRRITAGYVCPECFEPHEHPFPTACPVCGLARPLAQEKVTRMFAGYIADGETYEDEEARLAEENARRMHRPGSSIVLPRGVNIN